jgi:hypothetical protein
MRARHWMFKLVEHARLLPKFAAHLDAIGAEVVTIDLALEWAVEPVVPAGSVVPAMRVLFVRGFAHYLSVTSTPARHIGTCRPPRS